MRRTKTRRRTWLFGGDISQVLIVAKLRRGFLAHRMRCLRNVLQKMWGVSALLQAG